MVITLTKRNGKVYRPKRQYNRRKPLKREYKLMKDFVLKSIIVILLILLLYTTVYAQNTTEITVKTDDRIKTVLVSKDTRDTIAEKICTDNGLTNNCWQILKAMRGKESQGGKLMIGDDGKSVGWYQIQTKLHGVSVDCAMDYNCSTEWTVKNLKKNGFEKNQFLAIKKHNGDGKKAVQYANAVINQAKIFNY